MIFLADAIRELGAPRTAAYHWADVGVLSVTRVGSALLLAEDEVQLFRLAVRFHRKRVSIAVIQEVLADLRSVPAADRHRSSESAVLVRWSDGWRYYRRLADARFPLLHERRWAEALVLAELL